MDATLKQLIQAIVDLSQEVQRLQAEKQPIVLEEE